jgi:hypothetical protein
MKQYLIFTTLFLVVFFSNCEKNADESCGLKIDNSNNAKVYNILFIGNSQTNVNYVPGTIAKIAKLKGDSFYTRMQAPNGFSLKDHLNNQQTLDAISFKKWDYAVIQIPGSLRVLSNSIADTVYYKYAKLMAEKIRANCENTKIIEYITQAYKNGVLTLNDTATCRQDPQVCNYEGMQKRMKDNTIYLSELLNAEVAPAGTMWEILMRNNENLDLFSWDNVHGNPIGSYTSALTIYTVISRRSVIGAYIPSDVPEAEANIIQNTINNSLYNCNPNWRDYK